ncbi:MAG: ABC transporter substrate-binding protein [Acidimicrobiia bacterium]|nr:ABC transporter substrate-binding protein [Acidimicrobiia bacterium]
MTRTRRTRWLLALFLIFTLVAAACGSDDDDSASDTAADDTADSGTEQADDAGDAGAGDELETITFQLDWVPNTNHTGIYAADVNGYYAEEGIELEILPYSGGNGDTIVAEGLADFAVSFQNSITLARPAGVPIKAVASVVQHTVEAIGVKADRDDIASPKDLDGLTYAGFGGPFEVPVMTAVIQADGGTGEFETVVLDTAAYEAVYNGAADFVIPFLTWEGIEAELREEPMKYFEYADFGLPDQYSVVIVASEEWLAENEDLATRFMSATKRGYEWGAANPDEASQLLIDANPGVFNEPELVERSQALMSDEFFLDENGEWGTIDVDRFAAYSSFLYNAGIISDADGNSLAEEPDWSEFVDTSYLN